MAPRDSSRETKSIVQSFAKGFRILEAFTAREPALTLSQLAQRTGLDKGTVFRMVNTLAMLGYVQRDDASRRFRLTLKTLDLGFNAIARTELRDLARPVLRSLVGQVNEAASIGVLDGADVVYVERVQAGLTRLGVDIRIGTRIPAYCSAIGHAILAQAPPDDVIRILELRERVKLTPRTPVVVEDIMARLAAVRRAGFAVSDQEVTMGLRVVAAAIADEDGHPVAAISVAAPVFGMPVDEFVARVAEPVTAAAASLARAIRAHGTWSVQFAAPGG